MTNYIGIIEVKGHDNKIIFPSTLQHCGGNLHFVNVRSSKKERTKCKVPPHPYMPNGFFNHFIKSAPMYLSIIKSNFFLWNL